MKKKWTTLALILLLSIFILPVYTAGAEGKGSGTIDKAKTPSPLDDIIVLPMTKYDVKEAGAIKERLKKIPVSVLQALKDQGVKIKLLNDVITSDPDLAYLKGVVPRGWENTGMTWDDLPGVSEQHVYVRIGYSKKGKGHNTSNLELHETIHAIDRFVYDTASSNESFMKVFDQEVDVKYGDDEYVKLYPEEYFAEAATLYLYNEDTRKDLKESMPLTYKYMDKLFNNK